MADRTDHPSMKDADRALPSFFRGSAEQPSYTGGLLSALILGSLAVVVAMIALTIAVGRAPVPAAASDQQQAAPAVTPAAPTSYPAPEPTAPRYTPEPIVMGAPQKPPYYEPTPSASSSAGDAEDEPADEQDADSSDADGEAEDADDRLAGLEERIEQRIRDRIGQLGELGDD